MIDQKSNTPLSPKKRQFQPFITIAAGIGLTLLLGLGSQATLAKSTEKTSSHHKGHRLLKAWLVCESMIFNCWITWV